jgi:CPA2 family monovalent cation:H+ antiporter-2
MPTVESETGLLLDVSVALAIAFAGGWIATRLKLSPIVGYVTAGVIISPFTPGFVGDAERLRLIADIGIVLLLFGIGVQFSMTDLFHAGPRVIAAASAQVIIVLSAGWAAGAIAGWPADRSLYIGAAAAITSSVVAVRLLDDRGDIASNHGRLAVSWSIVQDIWAVVLIVALGAVAGGDGAGEISRDAGLAALKVAAFLAGVFVIGLRVMPFVLGRVAEERSRELFFIAIAALALSTALASEYMGLSLALGAFLAGLVVSESDLSHRVLGELLPTRDVFAVLFFVSVGMFIDPTVIADEWAIITVSLALIIALRLAASRLLLSRMTRPHTATLAAVALLPAGEFSFVLARAGLDEGALSEPAFAAIVTATAISIVLSPPAMTAAYGWIARETRARQAPSLEAGDAGPSRLGYHAVICGYGAVGRIVASLLSPRFETIVAEDDARAARDARNDGFFVVEGNPANAVAIERMRLDDARVLILALPDAFATRLVAERAREVNPHLDVVGIAASASEAERLASVGVGDAAVAEREVALELARHALHRFGVPSQQVARIIQTARARLR